MNRKNWRMSATSKRTQFSTQIPRKSVPICINLLISSLTQKQKVFPEAQNYQNVLWKSLMKYLNSYPNVCHTRMSKLNWSYIWIQRNCLRMTLSSLVNTAKENEKVSSQISSCANCQYAKSSLLTSISLLKISSKSLISGSNDWTSSLHSAKYKTYYKR